MGKPEEVLKATDIDEEAEGADSHIGKEASSLLKVPLPWVGFSIVIGFVKAVRKFTSPRAQRKRLVNKNAFLLKSIDELFLKGRNEVNNAALKELMQKFVEVILEIKSTNQVVEMVTAEAIAEISSSKKKRSY